MVCLRLIREQRKSWAEFFLASTSSFAIDAATMAADSASKLLVLSLTYEKVVKHVTMDAIFFPTQTQRVTQASVQTFV